MIMTIRTSYIFALLFVATLHSASCSKHDTEGSADGAEITFSEILTKSGEAGGIKIDEASEFQAETTGGFGVFGLRSANNTDFTAQVFETDAAKQVTYSGGNWSYENKAKWIRSNYYRFRAFWPYDNVLPKLNSSSSANLISIEYSTAVDKYDLMVAYATRYPLTQGVEVVNMQFDHALAAVCFKVKFDSASEGTDYVDEFYLKGLYPNGTLLYGYDGLLGDYTGKDDATDIYWLTSSASFDTDTEQFRWYAANDAERREFTNETVATIYGNDHLIFVIPQTITSQTTLNFTTTNGGDALHSIGLVSGSDTIAWEAGKVYTYTVNIKGSGLTLNVDIKDWTDTDANIDINL